MIGASGSFDIIAISSFTGKHFKQDCYITYVPIAVRPLTFSPLLLLQLTLTPCRAGTAAQSRCSALRRSQAFLPCTRTLIPSRSAGTGGTMDFIYFIPRR